MRGVTYSMGVSLDGYIAGPDGNFDWAPPDEEVLRQLGAALAMDRSLVEVLLQKLKTIA